MEGIVLAWLTAIFALSDLATDPIQHAWRGRSETRTLECERLSQVDAHARHPGQVPAPAMRSAALMEIDALVCQRRLLPYGEREARDEAVLSRLDAETAALAELAMAEVPGAPRWIVDAFYPQPQVAAKIAGAARQQLAEAGATVSARAPLLGADDVTALHGVAMDASLPLACQRMTTTGALGKDDAFLAVALVRADETQLHGGVCHGGRWRWLR